MNPSDIRDLNWSELRDRVCGIRATVYSSLQMFGPCTTRALAVKMEVDILTVRPRVTELVELGFAECVRREGGEGVYRALSYTESSKRFHDARAIASGQGVQTSLF